MVKAATYKQHRQNSHAFASQDYKTCPDSNSPGVTRQEQAEAK